MSERPTGIETLMATAAVWSKRSTCSRLNVGAVVADRGRVLGTGYNGAPRGIKHCFHAPGEDSHCPVSKHAEENVVANAAFHGNSTQGSSLYVTHEPCYRCAGLIINAGIFRVYFAEPYGDGSGIELLRQADIAAILVDL